MGIISDKCSGATLIALGTCIVFAPLLNPSCLLAGMDFLNLLYPHAAFLKDAYFAGEIPLWNWFTWNGSPQLAALQSAPLYPPMWLTVLLPLPYGLQINILGHMVFAGTGVIRLATRHFGVRSDAAAVAGIAYCASAFTLGHIEQVNVIAAMSYAPWIFCAALHLRCATSASVFPLSLLVSLCFLAGHPQELVLALLFLEIMIAGEILLQLLAMGERKASVHAWLKIQLALLMAAPVVGAQLLPTYELSTLSERIWPYSDPASPALKWPYLVARAIPHYFNRLAGTEGQPIQFAELGMYVGLLAVVCFPIGFITVFRAGRFRALALLTTWFLVLNYALGEDSLVFPVLSYAIGFLRHSRGAARALNIELLLFLIVSASGMTWLFEKLPARFSRAAALAAFALAIVDLAFTHHTELQSLVVSADVLRQRSSLTVLRGATDKPNRLYRFMSSDSDFYQDRRLSAVAQRIYRMQPNLSGYNPPLLLDGYEEGLLPVRHYANFLRQYNRNLRGAEVDAALLWGLGAGSMLTEYELAAPGKGWKLSKRTSYAGRNYWHWDSAYPSAWLIPFELHGSSPEVAVLSRYYVPPGRTSLPHPFASFTPEQAQQLLQQGDLKVTERRTNSLRFSSSADMQGSYLFLQTWYPGWKVEVPGTKFRGQPLAATTPVTSRLTVPGGTRRIRVYFDPFSFRLGLFITMASLAGMLAIAMLSKFQDEMRNALDKSET